MLNRENLNHDDDDDNHLNVIGYYLVQQQQQQKSRVVLMVVCPVGNVSRCAKLPGEWELKLIHLRLKLYVYKKTYLGTLISNDVLRLDIKKKGEKEVPLKSRQSRQAGMRRLHSG
ncbi:hypothetical protein M0802_013420 [Mischocyttarus mexicanus]|nr:hypothetical protein M0802_013434 [Mischocyttarus mexicanus]KAI4483409.1 hypothetical protein M0802_013420 [Mischocyttarus mexicanus]